MATTLEELEVKIRANTEQFQKDLDEVKGTLAKLENATKLASTATGGELAVAMASANIATEFLTSTVTKLTGSISSLIKDIVRGGSALNRISTATNVVTANLGITKKEVDDLRDSLAEANTFGIYAEEVIKTLAMSGLIELSRGLKSVDARSGKTIEGVSALVLAMKDLSAAGLVPSQQGIEALTKFIQRGDTQYAESVMQIGNLSDEYEAYAGKIGKTASQLTAKEKAEARMLIVMREAQKVYGAYSATMQTAGKLSESIAQKLTDIKATIGSALSPIFDTLALGIYTLISGVEGGIKSVTSGIQSFAITVAGYILVAFRLIGRLLSKIPIIGQHFKALANLSFKGFEGFNKLSNGVKNYGKQVDNATGKVKELKEQLAGFDEMQTLELKEEIGGGGAGGGAIGGIGELGTGGAMEGLNNFSEEINKKADEVEKKINDFIEKIKTKLAPFSQTINDIKERLKGFFKFLSENSDSVKFAIVGLIAIFAILGVVLLLLTTPLLTIIGIFALFVLNVLAIGYVLFTLHQLVTRLIPQIKEIFETNFNKIKEKVEEIISQVKENIGTKIEEIKNSLAEAWESIKSKVTETWENVKTKIDEISTWIKDNIISKFESIKNNLAEAWESIKSKAIETWENVKTKINEVSTWIMDNIISKFENVKGTLANIWENIKAKVVEIWENVKTKVNGVIDWFKTSATQKVEEFKNKINEIFGGIKEKAVGIWNDVKNAFVGGINTVIEKINSFKNKINSLISDVNKVGKTIANAMGLSWKDISFNIPDIKPITLAKGGIVENSTIALLGEAGKEAVVPLENNTEWIDKLASKINRGGQTLVVKIGDEKIFSKVIDYLNDKSLSGNISLNI